MPVWLAVLSDQLPVVALVSFYLTNKLIGRGPLPTRLRCLFANRCGGRFANHPYKAFHPPPRQRITCGIIRLFGRLSPASGQVTHVLRTRLPLTGPARPFLGDEYGSPPPSVRQGRCVRLACITRAASVHPEPRSCSHFHSAVACNCGFGGPARKSLPITLQLLRRPLGIVTPTQTHILVRPAGR